MIDSKKNLNASVVCSLYSRTLLGAYLGSHYQNSLLINAQYNKLIGQFGEPTQWAKLKWNTQFALAEKCVRELIPIPSHAFKGMLIVMGYCLIWWPDTLSTPCTVPLMIVLHAVSHEGEVPYETQVVLSKWLGITRKGVVAMKDDDFDYEKYLL